MRLGFSLGFNLAGKAEAAIAANRHQLAVDQDAGDVFGLGQAAFDQRTAIGGRDGGQIVGDGRRRQGKAFLGAAAVLEDDGDVDALVHVDDGLR